MRSTITQVQELRAPGTGYTITPMQFAQRYGIGLKKVLAWLANGELRGVNVGTGLRKPRWRIRPADIDDFENRHLNVVQPKPERRRRQRQEAARPPGYIRFFAEG